MATALARWHMTTRSTRGLLARSRASVVIEGRTTHRSFRGLTVRHSLQRAERWILAVLADAAATPATP